MRERRLRVPIVAFMAAAAATLVSFVLPGAATSAPPGCANRTNTTYQTLLQCVTLEGVRAHQAAFQAIANDNNDPFYPGTRAAGTKGYADSVEYVADLLEDAGYEVTLDEFEFQFNFPVLLQQLTPVNATYPSGAFTGSGFGDVTRAVTPVDINLVPPRANTSGCDGAFTEAAVGAPIVPDPAGPDDFAGFASGNIALIQRGGCSFALKATNAQAAGAAAVIIFNQGNTPDREGLIVGTLAPMVASIPVVGASFANGEALSQPGSTARIRVLPSQTRTDVNVIAELDGVNDDNVVMAGAHLDSVTEGPGINDNGSGSAAILETALMMAKVKPQNTVRFAWWGAEEEGLLGSEAYVDEQVANGGIDDIALYLNYDMVGSPNFVYFVYDGDNSDGVGAPAGPTGSAAIEDVYEAYYTARDIPYKGTDFDGRSDYGPFIAAGVDIPSGGLFTGAEGVKTAQEVTLWGGTAGAQYDPCYHLACDTFAGTGSGPGSTAPGRGPIALEVNSDLIAYAQLTFAFSTETVNGVPGKPVPGSSTP
jgi:Zn-dependent M28 family amino/carboxypeptidase